MDAARMTDNSVISIDFDAIAQNMAVLRGMVGPSCAVNAVVKADAYGLGAVRVARRLVQSGAAMLTVYSPAQAEQLEGLPVPVLVLQAVRTLVRGEAIHSMLVAGRLHLVVHDLHHVAELIVLADEHGVRIPVHLELDTGLGRGGARGGDERHAREEAERQTSRHHLFPSTRRRQPASAPHGPSALCTSIVTVRESSEPFATVPSPHVRLTESTAPVPRAVDSAAGVVHERRSLSAFTNP